MKAMLVLSFLVCGLITSCGDDSDDYYQDDSYENQIPTEAKSEETVLEENTLIPVEDNSEVEPESEPEIESISIAQARHAIPVVPYEEFENTEKTSTTYLDYAIDDYFAGALGDVLGEVTGFNRLKEDAVEGFGLGWFMSGSKKPTLKRSIRRVDDEYDEIYGDDYYFARITKFRSPEDSGEIAKFAVEFEVAPGDGKDVNNINLPHWIGDIQSLYPGQPGRGFSRIRPIPKDLVQSWGGLWDQKAPIKVRMLKVTGEINGYLRNSKILKKSEVIMQANDVIDFWSMEKNKVYTRRYFTTLKNGKKNAVIEIEFWKGYWKTNI